MNSLHSGSRVQEGLKSPSVIQQLKHGRTRQSVYRRRVRLCRNSEKGRMWGEFWHMAEL